MVEEGSADKVTVVLAAAAEGTLQAGPVGVGCVLVAAVEAETVPAAAAAARGAAVAPVWILGSWTGPVIQGYPGSFAAGSGSEDPAAERTEIAQTVGLWLGNRASGTVEALGMDLAVAPGTAGACGAADRVGLPGCVRQRLAEGGVVLGKESGHLVVLVEVESRGSAAGLGEEPGQVGHNMEPDPESRSLLVPAVHKIPSKQNVRDFKHNRRKQYPESKAPVVVPCDLPVDHMACCPCLQVYALALPPDIAVDLEGRTPGRGKQVPVVDLWEDLAATADCMDCLLHTVDLSSSPLGPWVQVAGNGKNTGKHIKTPTKQRMGTVQTYMKQSSFLKHITGLATKSIEYLDARCAALEGYKQATTNEDIVLFFFYFISHGHYPKLFFHLILT